jgi:ATP-dependent DNA ligase
MRRIYSPELATLVDEVPTGPGWIHEVKFDGYRIIAHRDGGEVRLLTRGKLDWADHFPSVVEAVGTLKGLTLAVDGEVCALNEEGSRRSNCCSRRSRVAGVNPSCTSSSTCCISTATT